MYATMIGRVRIVRDPYPPLSLSAAYVFSSFSAEIFGVNNFLHTFVLYY